MLWTRPQKQETYDFTGGHEWLATTHKVCEINEWEGSTHLLSLNGGMEYTVPIKALDSNVKRNALLVRVVGSHPRPSPPRRLATTINVAVGTVGRPDARGRYGLFILES